MKKAVGILVAVLAVLWPFAVYFGLKFFDAKYLAVFLATALVLRLILPGSSRLQSKKIVISVSIIGLLIAALSFIHNRPDELRYYPVVVNASLFAVFLMSLIHPPTVIERLARLQDPELPESGIRYTRNVTWIWLFFFICNGSIAFYTASFSSLEIWTLYNGLIAYLLMGGLFIGEWSYRKIVLGKG